MKYKLKEICIEITDGSHFSPKGIDEGYPMLSVKDMEEFGFNYKNCKYISKEDFEIMKKNGCVPHKGDVLVAKDGSYMKEVFVCEDNKEEAILSSIAIFRPNISIVQPDFLCFLLKTPYVYNYIKSNCVSGSALPRIVLKSFKDVVLDIPNLDIQSKISKICSSINYKIRLNKEINDNLQQQVSNIYRTKFIDFDSNGGELPQDFRYGILGDLSNEIICGKTPSTKNASYYGNEVPFITIPDMHNNVYIIKTDRYLSKEGANSQTKKYLPRNTICVSCIGTAGLVSLVNEKSQTNQQINSIIPKPNISSYYIYSLMKTLKDKIISLGQCGSTIVNLNKEQFSKLEVLIPSNQSLIEFDNLVAPIFDEINKLQLENVKLSELRDTLLPKLMSGEIDVSNIKLDL